MGTLSFPFLTIALLALAAGSALLLYGRLWHPRGIAAISSGIAALCALACLWAKGPAMDRVLPWLVADQVMIVPLICFLSLLFISTLMMPQEDATAPRLNDLLIIAFGSTLAFTTVSGALFLAGWTITAVPVLRWGPREERPARRLSRKLMAGSVALGVVLVMPSHNPGGATVAAALFTLAVMLHQGLFPLHGGMTSAFDRGHLWPVCFLYTGMLGAVLTARAGMFLDAGAVTMALDWLCVIACLGSLLAGVRAFAERKPRKVIALVLLSASSSVAAGISCGEPKGITGGLLIWLMVMVASTGLVAVLRALEARTDQALDPRDNLGLGSKAPRLSFFFLLFCLALVGIPGTLGFVAEDLLFHGALHTRPLIGIALPLATALNAIHLLRTWHLLFNGRLAKDVANIPDALGRERIPLLLFLATLIVLGVAPGLAIAWSGPAAEHIAQAIGAMITSTLP